MNTVSRPSIAVHVVPPELDDLLSDDTFWASAEAEDADRRTEPEPFQSPAPSYLSEGHSAEYLSAGGDQVFGGPPAGLDWPAELPVHLPFEETVQAAQRDADRHARNAGRDMRYPYLSGVLAAYLEMVLRDYALAGAVLAEARNRIEFLESLTRDDYP